MGSEWLVRAASRASGVKGPGSAALSLTLHLTLAAALLVLPLFVEETLPVPAASIYAFLVDPQDLAPPPPPPPPPPAPRRATRKARMARPPAPRVEPRVDFVAPIEVPEDLPLDDGLELDLGGFGVEGGVEGGVPGGVVGGVVGGLPEPPPPPAPVVRVGGALRPPALIRRVEPRYPKLASDSHVGGTVILEAHVDATGRVKSVEVLRSAPLLDEAAVEAVRQWRYRPLLLNGLPTEFLVTVTVTFHIRTAAEG